MCWSQISLSTGAATATTLSTYPILVGFRPTVLGSSFCIIINFLMQWRGNVFWTGGLKIVRSCQRLGGEAPQTPLFSNARFYEQDTQQTYFDRHQLHARSSDRNFFRIIFYRGKQDCLLPLGFSNHARITVNNDGNIQIVGVHWEPVDLHRLAVYLTSS